MKAVIAVVLAASAISCPAWEEGPGTMHQRDSAPLRQARMALIALRAAKTVSSEVKERQYAIHPSRRLVGDLEAASLLADYPKPVSCASSVSDGYLSINCRRVPSDNSAQLQEEVQEELILQIQQALRAMSPNSQPITGESLVWISGAGESLLSPLRDLETFLRDFRIALSFSIVPPDDEARAKGAIAAFTLGPPGRAESP